MRGEEVSIPEVLGLREVPAAAHLTANSMAHQGLDSGPLGSDSLNLQASVVNRSSRCNVSCMRDLRD